MEIRIGVQNVARDVVLESGDSAEAVEKSVTAAITEGGVLTLRDEKGRLVLVPAAALAFVEIGSEESRRVGFGTL